MPVERPNATAFKDKSLTVIGAELKVGDRAPEVTLLDQGLAEVRLLDATKGKVRLLNVILSVDTGICAPQTKRFQDECAKLPHVAAVTISMDLPFGLKRFCGAEQINHLVLSDHRDGAFGTAYGLLAKEMRVLNRAVIIVGPDDKIRYVQYRKQIAEHPDYDAALAALKTAT